MIAVTNKTVRELALEMPNATRVFEKLGIDYCCGGKKSLDQACADANLNIDEVIRLITSASQEPKFPGRDWEKGSAGELANHIIKTHHTFVREEGARIVPLLAKVCSVHGKNHPELFEIQSVFLGLVQELAMHLMKEENILFPYILRLEESVLQGEPASPAPFGTVRNPILMMTQEHDSAGVALQKMRAWSHDYDVPAEACVSYRTLYGALKGFEADLHQHIHLENNILFPQAMEMENSRIQTCR